MGRKYILWHRQYYWNESYRTYEHVVCLVDARRHCYFSHHTACKSTRDGKVWSNCKSVSFTRHLCYLTELCRLRIYKCSKVSLTHFMNEKVIDWSISFTGWQSQGFVVLLGFLQVRISSIPVILYNPQRDLTSRLYTHLRGARQQLK
jgi:hypothetical protein